MSKIPKQEARKPKSKNKSTAIILVVSFIFLFLGTHYGVCRSYNRAKRGLSKVQEEIAEIKSMTPEQFYNQCLEELRRQECDLKKKVEMTRPFYKK